MSRKRYLGLLAGAVLVVSACGARLSDEQIAALENASSSDGAGSTVTSVVTDEAATPTTAAGGSDQSASPSGGNPSPGQSGGEDSGGGDGGGGTGPEAGGGASSCAGGGASDVGVSETEIKIGNVSTISGPIPGFGQTGVNAVKAYVNMVNASGGVCGRQLTLVTADDRLQSGTNKSETDKLSNEVIGFVGGTTVVDSGAAQSVEGTNIATTGLAVADLMIKSPNQFPTSPINLADGGNGALAIFRYMKKTHGVNNAGLVWPAQASAKARMEGYKVDLKRAGIGIAFEQEVSTTQTSYAAVAKNIESKGVDIVITTLEITGMSNLAKDMQQNDYFPKVPFYGAQVYGNAFLTQAGPAAEPTIVGLAYSIIEDAPNAPAVREMVEWYQRTNPGSEIDLFTILAWAAADMYVEALESSQGPPTRDTVMSYLKGLTSFDADGVLAEINPAGKTGMGCFMVAEVDGGKWVRSHPASGYDCSYS